MSRRYLTRRRGNLEGYLRPAVDITELVARSSADIEDRAVVFVKSVRAFYALDRQSSATEDGTTVLTPTFGSGRWLLIDASGGGGGEETPDHTLVHDTFTTGTVTVAARRQILVYDSFTVDPDTSLVLQTGGALVVL